MSEPQPHIYEFGDFRVDVVKRLLLRRDGQTLPLTPKAFDTLLYLVQHSGVLLDKDDLMRAIWPDTVVEENNLTQNVSALRRVLGERRDEHRYIVTVPGTGYRFVADVKTLADANGQEVAKHSQWKVEQIEENAARSVAEIGARKNRIWLMAAAAVIAAGLGMLGLYLWRAQMKPAPVVAIRTIAVLPFKPLVVENRNEALELGMADTLIARLSNSKESLSVP